MKDIRQCNFFFLLLTNSGNYFRFERFKKRIWDCSIWTVLWSPIPPTRKGYRSSYLEGSSRFPRVLPGRGLGGGGGALKRTIQHFNCWYGWRKKFFSLTSIYLAQVEKIHWQKTEENTDYWESNNNTTKLRHMEFVSFNWSRGATARTTYCISRTMVKFHRQL